MEPLPLWVRIVERFTYWECSYYTGGSEIRFVRRKATKED